MLAAMVMSTSRIGLVGTLSTTIYPPYLLARQIATLDHLSGGRAGWNVVTSSGAAVAGNFGMKKMWSTEERYERAEEFLTLVEQLWDSWDAGAVLLDRTTGRFADASKVHEIDFKGRYFRSRGPMTLPRPPQGHPVIMQAGASDAGRQFSARHAEIIVSHRNTPEAMKAFRDDMRDRMRSVGRDPDTCKIFFTMCPFIGDTEAEAKAIRAERMAKATVNVEVGLAYFSTRVGFDFRGLPLDEPLDPAKVPGADGAQGIFQQHTERQSTLREIAMLEAMKETFVVTGTATQVADQMADVMAYVGGDGIAIRDTMLPSSVMPIVDRVVPELRRRGLFRDRYRYQTFRENLLDQDAVATPAPKLQVAVGGTR
jgi:FMN-dependent oxidoreductase (nitrilotriacetate monooxygenase family)